jgi:hypothetical protein
MVIWKNTVAWTDTDPNPQDLDRHAWNAVPDPAKFLGSDRIRVHNDDIFYASEILLRRNMMGSNPVLLKLCTDTQTFHAI